jgi:hypothetical protein
MTVEADLCKELKISWADARDLASYARGKLNIIPGDTMAEQIHRESIFTTAIEADKQRKRNMPNTNRGEPEQNSQNLNNPEQHFTPDCQELVMAVQDVTSPTRNIMIDGRQTASMTVEADLCRELNISRADARDLASYARRKLNIIPSDTMAEQIHRESIFTIAIQQHNQNLNNLEQHNTPDRQELVMAVQDATMNRGNAKVANEAAKVGGTTKTKTDQSGWVGCVACLQCLNCLGDCFLLFSFC